MAKTTSTENTETPETDTTPPAEGYITFDAAGEGAEFRDPDGGYRFHMIRGLPVKFGGKARVSAAFAHKLVADAKAIYCDAPQSNSPPQGDAPVNP